MGIISKTVKVTPRGKSIPHYKNKGYNVKHGEELEVKVEDLSTCSTETIEAECDYCGEHVSIRYVDYNRQTKNGSVKLCCLNCVSLKREDSMFKKYGNKNAMHIPEFKKKFQETNLKKYGSISPFGNLEVKEKQKKTLMKNYSVENPSLSKEIQDKRKQTFIDRFGADNPFSNQDVRNKAIKTIIERYGVDNVSKNKDIQHKREQTFMENYGVTSPLKNKECFEKLKQTNMNRYGVKFVPQLDEVKQKVRQTNLKRYGYEYLMQSPEFLEKWLMKNGSDFVKSSSQQRYICSLYNGILNYPFKCFALDIYLPDEKLDIEFDGSGHRMSINLGNITEEEFEKKELYRNIAIKREGYKQMRIISTKDFLPFDDILLQMLSYAKEYFLQYPNHSWIEFNIDTFTVRNAEHKSGIFYDYGELRKIK